ncbi:glycosyltransferase family 2 protein [Acetobacterium bakii]|uniref:Glycosyl transferase family 2 n=1 Tax=Acetobacterium bakii TaxID=52689 RepID=A0A0L6U3I3_9FIRM|nr:glycosyltransferase family 2 protein [Acetobacterium bakii]KNZ43084.1 glycosyl transferase family 2 [Acetobacterium bakii]
MKSDVSIIIPNYNGEKYIGNCLDSLMGQSFEARGTMEIIVVDDCSGDHSVAIIKDYQQVKLIENPVNSGFARSVNQGIRASNGSYCLLLNNDVVVDENFVKKLYNHINANPRVFSVSSKMIRYFEREKLDDAGDFYNILGWAYKRGDGAKRSRYDKPTAIFSTCAGAGIYRRSILDEIGLFDEAFFAYMEDVDLSYRGKIFGYLNHYEPGALCYHIGSATTADGEKYSPFKVNISARNNIYVAYKNMPFMQLLLNSPFLMMGFSIKYLLFRKRGYGKDYRAGIKEGLKTLKKIEKIPVQSKNLGHYVLIEVQLILNLFRFVGNKLRK